LPRGGIRKETKGRNANAGRGNSFESNEKQGRRRMNKTGKVR